MIGAGGCAILAGPASAMAAVERAFQPEPADALNGATRLSDASLGASHRKRFGVPTGRGLAGRLHQDHTKLTPDGLVTPNELFYIRTRAPSRLDHSRPWVLRLGGLVERPSEVLASDLAARARPMGVHLLECAGNGAPFGLLSAAEWSGVPVSEILEHVQPSRRDARVLVSGFDKHTGKNLDQAGASWIFTREQLADAFFATHMNGQPLPRDHGEPVRLFVPGWYGCACIKWANEVRFVGGDEPSTPHMREFASRTHQRGVPRLARNFRPASIDLTGMPIRVERWRKGGSLIHRVVGLSWGGDRPLESLSIQLGERAGYQPIESLERKTKNTWTLWSHMWQPKGAGSYDIRLRCDDRQVRTRRLDSGFYKRTVEIEDV